VTKALIRGTMYYRDHAPPHFHAIYGEHEATIVISIEPLP